jgi:hypothetical protein
MLECRYAFVPEEVLDLSVVDQQQIWVSRTTTLATLQLFDRYAVVTRIVEFSLIAVRPQCPTS